MTAVACFALYPLACGGKSTDRLGGAGGTDQSHSNAGTLAAPGAGTAGVEHGGSGSNQNGVAGDLAAEGDDDAGAGGHAGTPPSLAGASNRGGAFNQGGAAAEGGAVNQGGAFNQGGAATEGGAVNQGGAGPNVPIPGPVHVTVLVPDGIGNLIPSVGRSVSFLDAQGTQTVLTDAAGEASANVVPDAVVTLQGYTSPNDWVSTFGVQPGDNLVYDRDAGCAPGLGSMRVSLPPLAGAFSYEARGRGSSVSGSNGDLLLTDSGCFGAAGDGDLLAVARGRYSDPLAYILKKHVPFSDGSSVSFSADAWITVPQYSIDYFGNQSAMVVETTLSIGSRQYPLYTTGGSKQFAGEPGVMPLRVVGIGDPVYAATRVFPAGGAQQIIYNSFPRAGAPSLNIASNLLPWIANASLDFSSRVVTWQVTQPGAVDPDGAVVRIMFRSFQEEHWWTIVTPGSGFKLPFLQLGPTGALADVYPLVLDSSDYADYAALRRAPLSEALRTVDGFGGASLVRVSYAQRLPYLGPKP